MTATPAEGLGTRRTSVIPDLIDALLDVCARAMPDVTVVDNYGDLADHGDMLMVGVEDIDTPGMEDSAASQQLPATVGTNRSMQEIGTVTCVAESWNGEADRRAARKRAFEMVGQVELILRDDPKQGIKTAGLIDIKVASHRLLQGNDENGARALVVFDIGFKARL